MVVCRFCDHDNPPEATRCQSCGGPLPVEQIPAGAATTELPAAGGSDPLEDQLLDLLRRGRKIEAIKIYREKHRAGLKEAKDAVEALAGRHNIAPRSAGCMSVMLLAIAAIWTLI